MDGHPTAGRSHVWTAAPWRPGDLDAHVLVAQTLLQLVNHEVDDPQDVGLGELVEDDDLVETVEELGAEVSLELLGDLGLHLLVAGLGVVGLGEAKVDRLGDVTGTEVGRQHDDGVLEVHHTTLCVGETSKRMTLNGLRRTFSVSWPPSS